MREQYVGNARDYDKYTLLRTLSDEGANRLGVCSMLTSSEGNTNDTRFAYLGQPQRHRSIDPELFDILARVSAQPVHRRLPMIQSSDAVPGARFFMALLSDDGHARRAYMAACRVEFADVDVVFLDPDIGLERRALPFGRKGSSRYVYLDEIRAFYQAGKSVLIYQHFGREERRAFIASRVARLQSVAVDAAVWAYRTKHVVFFLLLNQRSDRTFVEAAQAAALRWGPGFISDQLVVPADGLSS